MAGRGTSTSTSSRDRPTLRDEVQSRRSEIVRIARRYGANNVRVFGSVARGTARRASDVDFLVNMDAGRSLMDLAGLALDLEKLLGRRVDVFTPEALKDRIRPEVLRSAISL